jgi:hypothetical protein
MNSRNLEHAECPVDATPRLFECFPDREQTELPPDYLPEASNALIAGDAILKAIGYRPGSNRPRRWIKKNRHVFRKPTYDEQRFILQVRRSGDFWVVEKFSLNLYALVCAFSRQPIWTRTCQSAMRLADHCEPFPQPPIAGCWLNVRDYSAPFPIKLPDSLPAVTR